jgi:hypothetical protein
MTHYPCLRLHPEHDTAAHYSTALWCVQWDSITLSSWLPYHLALRELMEGVSR